MDVSKLSDSELREALIAAGVAVGPITATTRRLFENKLKRLQNTPGEEGDAAPAATPPATTSDNSAGATPDTKQADTELPTNDPPPEPTSYFGVALPANLSPSKGEDFVFGNRKDALKAAKDHSGARFKEFATKEEALKFSSQPASVPNPQTPQPKPIPGESSEFRGPKTPELSKFRGYIEKGQLEVVRECIWSNPRYLISGGDAPVILQEGCRYNALHVCALKNQAVMATLVLETLEDEAFMAKLYPQDAATARTDRINHMLDLYLNMPNKGNCETPLHFACKFGNVDVVKVLLAHPMTNRLLPNDRGETPEQVTCTRVQNKSPGTKKNILKLIQATCFVPLMRPADKCGVAVVGEPRLAVETVGHLCRSPSANPYQSPLVMDACAGPMSPSQAQEFRKKWMAHTSVEQRKQFLSICCKDDEKGQERIGRILAQTEGVGWQEYWEFLEGYVDLSTPAGLGLLEDYLEQRTHEEAGRSILSSNTTICAEMETTQGESDPAPGPEDSFTEKLCSLDDQFALLTLRSPSAPADGNERCNAVEDINPWKDKRSTKFEVDVDGNHNTESHCLRAMAPDPFAPGGFMIAELHSAVQDLAVERAASSPPMFSRQKSDLESEGSDFISCASEESDQSFETYYTAVDSPPSCLTPPGTPNRPDQPVFLLGPEPTKVDSDVLHAVDKSAITPEFPNVSRWHRYVTAYSEEIRNKWSSPRQRDGSWSTSQRHGTRSRLALPSPWNTPVRGSPLTPSHTPGHTPVKLQAVRTNLMTALSDTDPIPATT